MEVIMGGSGSTGSSLLKNILNRHHEIFSGGETSFFAKQMIYDDWTKAKSRVLKRKFFGLRNHGWHIYNGTDLLQKEYLWNEQDLTTLLKESKSLEGFTTSFYSKPMELKGASIWLEKTPANSVCFSSFLNTYSNGKVIHMVRNPYDTIASLQNRGFDLYYAIGIYLINTACGIRAEKSKRCITVKYENLINNSESTVREICTFLEIKFSKEMLNPQGEQVNDSQLKGWNHDETEAIGKMAIGRFNKLDDERQDAIMEAVNMIQINGKGEGYYNSKIINVKGICEELDYDFYNISKSLTYNLLKKQQRKDRLMRVKRGYPTGFYYPLEILK